MNELSREKEDLQNEVNVLKAVVSIPSNFEDFLHNNLCYFCNFWQHFYRPRYKP